MRKMTRKSVLTMVSILMAVSILLGACGSSTSQESGVSLKQSSDDKGNASKMIETDMASDTDVVMEEQEIGETENVSEEDTGNENASSKTSTESTKVTKEMLVYRGSITVDSIKFDNSVRAFKKMIESVGGFIESEINEDNGDLYNTFVIEDNSVTHTYTATVRVPKDKYETVMNQSGELGDVRTNSSQVQNVTQEYGTYAAQLEVYEKEEKRYLEMLEQAKKDETMLQIQEKLFDVQVTIADIKSAMTNLETDVNYSYIDVSIREVSKFKEVPDKTETFGQRFLHTCKSSWKSFTTFLENILFLFIMAWYYFVIGIIVVLVVIRQFKHRRKKSEKTQPTNKA